jgi:hypothetical protein
MTLFHPSSSQYCWLNTNMTYKHTNHNDTQERELDGKYGNFHRCHCCTRNKFVWISFCCLSRAFFMSIPYVRNLWHKILIAVQVYPHNIDNTSDWCLVACMLAVQSYNSSAITHPIIYYSTQSCNHIHMITVPMIPPSPTFSYST